MKDVDLDVYSLASQRVLVGLPYVNRYVIVPIDPDEEVNADVEVYRRWAGSAKVIGELSLYGRSWTSVVALSGDLAGEPFHDAIILALLKFLHESMMDRSGSDCIYHLNNHFKTTLPDYFVDANLRLWTIAVYQSLLEVAQAANNLLWASSAAEGLQYIFERLGNI